MGRKTVAQLEEENKALKEKLANQDQGGNTSELEAENNALREQLELTKQDKAESEARLMAEIEAMGENDVVIENGEVVGTGIKVMTPTEYAAYSEANGRVMGRPKGTKTKCTIEELRALINSDWTPSMIMNKHGIDAEEFKQLVWALSQRELRDKPIKFDLQRDIIVKG